MRKSNLPERTRILTLLTLLLFYSCNHTPEDKSYLAIKHFIESKGQNVVDGFYVFTNLDGCPCVKKMVDFQKRYFKSSDIIFCYSSYYSKIFEQYLEIDQNKISKNLILDKNCTWNSYGLFRTECDIFQVKDKKVVSYHTVSDTIQFKQAMGE